MNPPSGAWERKAWEAARRALGRLFTHAAVREVPGNRLLPQASMRKSQALEAPPTTPGKSERVWRVAAAVRPSSLSQIAVRVSEQERRPVARLVGGSHALAPPECRAMPVPGASGLRIGSERQIGPVEAVRLPDQFVRLPADPLRLWEISLLTLPKTAALGGLRLAKPQGKSLRVPRLPAARLGAARAGELALSQIPLTRRGLEAPRGVLLFQAFAAEHQRLAETAGLPLSDVDLLGVYPAIPIIAVRRLVVEDEGRRLRLWLKPESWWGRPSPRRITLLVGRQISSGKMLQAAG